MISQSSMFFPPLFAELDQFLQLQQSTAITTNLLTYSWPTSHFSFSLLLHITINLLFIYYACFYFCTFLHTVILPCTILSTFCTFVHFSVHLLCIYYYICFIVVVVAGCFPLLVWNGLYTYPSLHSHDTNLRQHRDLLVFKDIYQICQIKHVLPLLPSEEIVLNLLRRETKKSVYKTKNSSCQPPQCAGFHHFLQEFIPVCSHRSCSSLFAFVLKGDHSVGAHVPGPCLDFIKCKLEKILLEDNERHRLKHRN